MGLKRANERCVQPTDNQPTAEVVAMWERVRDRARTYGVNSPEFCLEGPSLIVGRVYTHHETGRLIRITSGQYLSEGRISNHWNWIFLDDQMNPTGDTGHGYGWSDEPIDEDKTRPDPCRLPRLKV